MHFRPCIDIHNGKVKQIVGGSLTDQGIRQGKISRPLKMRIIMQKMYQKDGLIGGHVILLNRYLQNIIEKRKVRGRVYWHFWAYPKKDFRWAEKSMPKMQKRVSGRRGQAHVIVTSYGRFRDGKSINWENMEKLKHAGGKKMLSLI